MARPAFSKINVPPARRGRGLTIIRRSLVGGAAGIAPLLLYVLLGPKDGNPIGLGLLAALALPAAFIGVVVGVICMAAEYFARQRR